MAGRLVVPFATGIPHARLRLIDRAGHSPHDERTAEVMKTVREFVTDKAPAA